MSGRTSPHFGFEIQTRVVPCVAVTRPDVEWVRHGDSVKRVDCDVVVKRVYGLTTEHALSRALDWMHQHGDPR